MLDERVSQFVNEAMQIKAREFDQTLTLRLLDIDSELVRAGQMGGTGRIRGYSAACQQDLRSRAQYVFIEIQRALGLFPQALDGTLKGNLVGLHITEVRGQCTALQRMLQERLGKSDSFGGSSHHGALLSQLNDECDHLRQKYTLEISAFLHAAAQREIKSAKSDGGVVIQGSVGVVQTGAYASATVTMSVGPEDREGMLKALDLVAAAFRESRQFADEHQRQMLEVVEQARVATQQRQPNPSLLRGMFTVICETLQILASSEGAMAALRAAALPFGIVL
jgi:hypothetical protein